MESGLPTDSNSTRQKVGLSGNESFHLNDRPTSAIVLDFWKWSSSDLLSNALRGRLAEFIVSLAIEDDNPVRAEWDEFDLTSKNGLRIEVKSSAFIQSWDQARHSTPRFGIQRTFTLHESSQSKSQSSVRRSDVYVFALLAHKDRKTVDPLNLDQWQFFVSSTEHLDATLGGQKSIGLGRLNRLLGEPVGFSVLRTAIDRCAPW